MIYLSKLGVSFIGLGFVLYMVALQSASGLLFLVLGILCGCYIVNLVSAWRAARHLVLTPPDAIMIGREGETITGTWEVENDSSQTVGLTEARCEWGTLFRLGALAGRERIHITPNLHLQDRGVYPFRTVALISSYPFGMIRCTRKLGIDGEFIVYPAAYKCTSPLASGFEPMVGGKYSGQNRSSSGGNFHGIRPMQPADPVKLIHWASSSKGLGLMVKEFDEELSGRVAIIMDAEPGKADDETLYLDWAARATASLILSALDEGHQVEYMNVVDLVHLAVPPFTDGSVVLESLARLEVVPGRLSRERLLAAAGLLPRKASICLVLTTFNEEVATFINRDLVADRRKVSLYLPYPWKEKLGHVEARVNFFGTRSMMQL